MNESKLDRRPRRLWGLFLALVIPWIIIAWFLVGMCGCAQARQGIEDYRETHEIALVGGWRDSTLWGGIRFDLVGRKGATGTMEEGSK